MDIWKQLQLEVYYTKLSEVIPKYCNGYLLSIYMNYISPLNKTQEQTQKYYISPLDKTQGKLKIYGERISKSSKTQEEKSKNKIQSHFHQI